MTAGKGLLSSSRPENLLRVAGKGFLSSSVDQLAECTIEQEQLIVLRDRGTNNSNGFQSH